MAEDAPSPKPSADVPTQRMIAWARNSAAWRLARRMMTEQEMRRAIARKAREKFEDISEAQLAALGDAAVDFGRTMLVLDDANYAEVKARSAALSGKSTRQIARKLAEKGVERKIIADSLADADDMKAALIFARKRRLGPFAPAPGDTEHRNKALASFARQGFGFDLAGRILAMGREEAEETLAGGEGDAGLWR